MDRKEYAVELKHNGCNCAQAVLCSFAGGGILQRKLRIFKVEKTAEKV